MAPSLRSSLPVSDIFRQEYLSFYRLLPLSVAGDRLRVAVAGEQCPEALEDLQVSYGMELDLVEVDRSDLEMAIQSAFATRESMVELVRDLDGAGDPTAANDEGLTDVRGQANQAPVVRFVNTLIREGYAARASDVHLEATAEGLRVRLRIDGVLSELPAPPAGIHAPVISRLKLLAELDIAERRAPQDGRIRVRLDERELDLRISTVPAIHGESVVMRLLDRGGQPVGLEELGMAPSMLVDFRRLASRPHGIVLATGPTGSGKTTSLYAALRIRSAVAEKIITVEDPVEYHIAGVTQIPVRTKAGVTFASALRSILRQDPDVLMVGEMRDRETAAIAVQAAMTGHLVFSTLHTNDAASAVLRLADLGVEPYLTAASLEGVIAQRLVRRICPSCPEHYRPDPAVVALVARRPVGEVTLVRGRGCEECRGTGFRGRIGLFEMLLITDELKDRIARGCDAAALRTLAHQQGAKPLLDDGWTKVQASLTTIEEVLRVAGA